MGVFAFQRSQVERRTSLYIRYLHMQVWKEASLSVLQASEQPMSSSSRWRWPREARIPASRRSDFRTYRRRLCFYHIGLKKMRHWSTKKPYIYPDAVAYTRVKAQCHCALLSGLNTDVPRCIHINDTSVNFDLGHLCSVLPHLTHFLQHPTDCKCLQEM